MADSNMSNVRCINFWDLCRICTASSEQKINIYSPDGRAKNLSHKISECLPVQIDEKDRLPKVICMQCTQQVEQMYDMRNISKNSQSILYNWLNHRTLQNDDKVVFIKDPVNDTGKSLSVVGNTPGGLVSGGSNQPTDLLSSIMQAVGMQVQQQQVQQQLVQQQLAQHQQYTITLDSHVPSQPTMPLPLPEIKSEKQNTLEEFIRLKPDIKITPLGKKDNTNGTSTIKQQQPPQMQTQTLTAMPPAQIQLQPQQLNELNVLLQQQALWQQLQQLQAQTQTFTSSSSTDDPTDSKKPKLNFVLSPAATAPQFASGLSQFGGTQPQIQLQLLPSGSNATNSLTAAQPQQFNAAALLSSLTGAQVVGNNAANMLSPNKCFLPITIRDENSDQQIVAHIDTKNLVLPTTYQVQMKLQSQLATADGQPIIQLTPTSIPATLQLTPQTLGNTTFSQSAATTQQNQFIVQQPQQQNSQQQQQLQQQQHMSSGTAQVTSHQIIRSPHSNPINNQVIIRNVSAAESSTTSSTTSSSTFKMPSPRQPQQQQGKYKSTVPMPVPMVAPMGGSATAAATAVSNNVPKVTQVKQQPTATPSNVTALQRLSSNTTITKLPKQQPPAASNKLPVLNKQNITISRISTPASSQPEPKATPLPASPKPQPQAQPPPAQPQTQPQPPPTQTQPQTQAQTTPPPPPALALQQQPTSASNANAKKVNRKSPEQQVIQKPTKNARQQQQILPVPSQQTTAQQPNQQQANNASVTDTTTVTSANSLTCPTCKRDFKKKEHLTQHMKLHAGLRPFKCQQEGCDKTFSRKEHLSRHQVSHSGQKMFTCDECKKPFSRKDNLNKHKRIHILPPGETGLNTCDICHKNFAIKLHLEKHREMHMTPHFINPAPTTQPIAGAQQNVKNVFEIKQAASTTPQTQTQPQVQLPQQQPQIMHVNLDGSTITITQASDSNMQTPTANYVQLGFPQFQNANQPTNQLVCKLEK